MIALLQYPARMVGGWQMSRCVVTLREVEEDMEPQGTYLDDDGGIVTVHILMEPAT